MESTLLTVQVEYRDTILKPVDLFLNRKFGLFFRTKNPQGKVKLSCNVN